jgi:hypothetical protein
LRRQSADRRLELPLTALWAERQQFADAVAVGVPALLLGLHFRDVSAAICADERDFSHHVSGWAGEECRQEQEADAFRPLSAWSHARSQSGDHKPGQGARSRGYAGSLWRRGEPYFPDVCRRVLMGDRSVPLTYMVFDVLRADGEDGMGQPFSERRKRLQRLGLDGPAWMTPDTFSDGRELYEAVCERGLEGWSRNGARPLIDPASAAGSRSRTLDIGVAIRSVRR